MYVCLFAFFSSISETVWDTLWQKMAFYRWEGSKTIILKRSFCRVIVLFYSSLRFLCKYERRLQKSQRRYECNSFANKLTEHIRIRNYGMKFVIAMCTLCIFSSYCPLSPPWMSGLAPNWGFLGYFETDWDSLWYKIAFRSWECFKIIIFLNM